MSRAGVSLTEVLVAAVLLAIGVGGCLGALSTALRFRSGAATREAMAAVASDRLTWFEAAGCTTGDSTIERPVEGIDASESWRISRDSATSIIEGKVAGRVAGVPLAIPVEARRRCD